MIYKFIHINPLHRTFLYVFTCDRAHKVRQMLWRTQFVGLPSTPWCRCFGWQEYPRKTYLSSSTSFGETKKKLSGAKSDESGMEVG